ncbi:MAG TPA: DUF4912 domain-containing protein, partial [Spirochaetales bacterium]|nr:DUF4912 domain-containing protein [Spirochaetales bacterium]
RLARDDLPAAFDELRANPAFSCLFLRVVKESVPEGKTAGSFEVVVGEDDDRWYLHLPDEGCSYHVDLYARLGNRSRLLAHSAVVRTPRALMADSLAKLDADAATLATLSGLASLEIAPAPEHHPSRILGGFDE